MFNFFQKKKKDAATKCRAKLQIEGMHCVSCAMNIDGELEEIDGVVSATTHYASATTTVTFDETKTNLSVFQKTIEKLGYSAEELA